MNASDVLVESLLDWGVDTIFGLPEDGINGFVDSLRTHKNRLRYIHVRHEETAAMLRGDAIVKLRSERTQPAHFGWNDHHNRSPSSKR